MSHREHCNVRPGELRGARWEEFDRKAKRWTIPAQRMKGGKREHTVMMGWWGNFVAEQSA